MQNRPLTILTGASRGMGLAMAEQLLQQGHQLITIARQRNAALDDLAARLGVPWAYGFQRTKALNSGLTYSPNYKTVV